MANDFADVVVLVPGITGSVLERDGQEIWGTSLDTVLRGLFSGGRTLDALKLDGDDPDVDDLGDGVRATRLVNDVHLFPGVCAIDGYTKIARRLRQRLGLSPGVNYFEFPYDWRRDNRVAARALQRFSGGWLKTRRTTHPNAKLVLLAHSMGGLVSRYFLEVLGGAADTRALVTFGTPYRGSINALETLVNGIKKAGVLDLTELTRSYTSIYQLLPIYPCIDRGDQRLVHVIEALDTLPFTAGQRERVTAAEAFHRRIEAAVTDNLKASASAADRYVSYPIVGIDQPTSQTAIARNGALEILRSRDTEDEGGDGTVPRVSASPIEMGEARAMYPVARHGSLQNTTSVLDQVCGILTPPRDLDRARGDAPVFIDDVTLSLELDSLFGRDEPVRFAVRPSGGTPDLDATIASTADAAPLRTLSLEARGTEWTSGEAPPLPPGVYRLTVSGDPTQVTPLTEIFTVV
jgi:hypothetical protein